MDQVYEKINFILVQLVNQVWEQESRAIITEEFKDISNNDMHVIEAIGLGDGVNMTSVAKKLNITVGSLTTAMNHLVRKGYVQRCRTEEDRRVVLVSLTEKGVRAYEHHKEFHHRMTLAIRERLDEKDIPSLLNAFDALIDFFNEYAKESE